MREARWAALLAFLIMPVLPCSGTASTATGEAQGLVVRVSVSPSPPRAGRRVVWHVRVTNRASSSQTLAFSTSQRADVVLRRAGALRYRWSKGRVFAQIPQDIVVAPNQTRTFDLSDVLTVRAGSYRLLATIAARAAPAPAVTDLIVGKAP